jgi:hypothetical protein
MILLVKIGNSRKLALRWKTHSKTTALIPLVFCRAKLRRNNNSDIRLSFLSYRMGIPFHSSLLSFLHSYNLPDGLFRGLAALAQAILKPEPGGVNRAVYPPGAVRSGAIWVGRKSFEISINFSVMVRKATLVAEFSTALPPRPPDDFSQAARHLPSKASAVFPIGHPDNSLSSFRAADDDAVKAFVPPWVSESCHVILYDNIESHPANTYLWNQHLTGHLRGEHMVGLIFKGFEHLDDQAGQVGGRTP